jgi:hypothetical protein
MRGQFFERFTTRSSDDFGDVPQVHRLIAARLGLRGEVSRQEIRTVGLHHQSARRNSSNEVAQMQAAALVADPARDTDVQAEFETGLESLAVTRETMQHRGRKLSLMRSQDGDEILVGIAFMQEERFLKTDRKSQLTLECESLFARSREVTVVVETGFAYGNDQRILGQGRQRLERGVVQIDGMVRMTACGRTQDAGRGATELQSGLATVQRGAGHDELYDPGLQRSTQNLLAIGVVAVVGQVDADVDQLEAHRFQPWR